MTQQLHENLRSAFDISRSEYFSEEKNGVWFKNQNNEDSIRIIRRNWGAFEVLCLQTKNRHQVLRKSGLYGCLTSGDTALIISESGRALSVSGTFELKGKAYLPKLGIKPAYVEGQSYFSISSNYHYIRLSPSTIPAVSPGFIKSVTAQQETGLHRSDSLMAELPQNFNRSFEKSMAVFQGGFMQLSGIRLKGNVKLVAREIRIDSTCQFEDLLLICDRIYIGNGFKGNLHVVATDSIFVGDRSILEYPSSLVLCPSKGILATFHCLLFGKNTSFSGAALALLHSGNSDKKVFIKLDGSSEYFGLVYSAAYLHLEGKLFGTVIADKLLLKTPSAVYENHLLSCEIDPSKYKGVMALPMLFGSSVKLRCCENLN